MIGIGVNFWTLGNNGLQSPFITSAFTYERGTPNVLTAYISRGYKTSTNDALTFVFERNGTQVASVTSPQYASNDTPGARSGGGQSISALTEPLTVGKLYMITYEVSVNDSGATIFPFGLSPFEDLTGADFPSTVGWHTVFGVAKNTNTQAVAYTTGDITIPHFNVQDAQASIDVPANWVGDLVSYQITSGNETAAKRAFTVPSAGTVYVHPTNGSDDFGVGSQLSPYKSMSAAFAAIGDGVGGTIIKRPGFYDPYEVPIDGADGNPLRITHMPGEKNLAIVLGDVDQHVSRGGAGVAQNNATRDGIRIDGKSYVEIDGIAVHKVWRNGIFVKGAGEDTVTGNIKITNCITDDTGLSGIYICGEVAGSPVPANDAFRTRYVYVEDNDVTQTNTVNDWNYDQINSEGERGGVGEAITIANSVQYIYVRRNHVHDSRQYGIDFKNHVVDGEITHNRIDQVTRYAIYLDSGELDVRRILVANNRMSNCRAGLVLAREEDGNDSGDNLVMEDIDIVNNVTWNMSRVGMHFQRHPKDNQNIGYFRRIRARFNSFYNTNTDGIYRDINIDDIAGFGNNIAGDPIVSGIELIGNVAWNPDGAMRMAIDVTGDSRFTVDDNYNVQDGTFTATDPLYVAPTADVPDFNLQAASPAIGIVTTASYIEPPFDKGFSGNTRVLPADAGAESKFVAVPSILLLAPADNAADVSLSAPLVMNFDMGMKQQGTVTLKTAGGANIEVFDLSTDGVWSAQEEDNDTVTITPTDPLPSGASLAVRWTGLESAGGVDLADNAGDVGWNFGTETPSTLAYWPGSAYAEGAQADATSSLMMFASFIWPDISSGKRPIMARLDGRQRIEARPGGVLRTDMSLEGRQIFDQRAIGAVAGDRVSVLSQLKMDGVSRPMTIYQVNDGSVQQTVNITAASGSTFRSASSLFIGTNTTKSEIYQGTIYRAAAWYDGAVYDTFSQSIMRDFVDASGNLVDRALSITAYGTPQQELDVNVPGVNSGTNLGSGSTFTLTGGPLSTGITSAFFDLSTTSFDESLATGASVSAIETNGDPRPTYSIVTDASNLFEISNGSLVRSSTAVTHDGSYHDVTIRETQPSGTKDRTFSMYPAKTGEDVVFGRLSISASRTTVFQGEHVFFSLNGLTDEEAALLSVEWDFGDNGETYDNLRSGFAFGTGARYKSGPDVIKAFTGTTGTRTTTVSVYRAGVASAVWTDTVQTTILDPATISNVHVVSQSANYTGMPTGTQYTSTSAALTAAWAQIQAGNDAIVYLRRGDEWTTGNDFHGIDATTNTLGSLLIRAVGTGEDPIVHFVKDEGWMFTGTNSTLSVSVSDIDPRGLVDTINLIDSNGENTYSKRTAFIFMRARGHLTMSRITGRGILQMNQDVQTGSNAPSVCLFDCKPIQFAPYSYYFQYAERSGLDGGTYVKDLEPHISKSGFNLENPGILPDGRMSLDGPGRSARAGSLVISRGKYAGFQGWSDGNTADQLRDVYDTFLMPWKQPAHRMASLQDIVGGRFMVTECEIEGALTLTNLVRSFGRFIIARNHIIAHAGCKSMVTADHRGLWLLSNVMVMAGVPSEQGGPSVFVTLDNGFLSTLSGAEDAENRRQRVIGNTFIDLRTSSQLQPNDTGEIEDMFVGITPDICQLENNLIYVPNRTVTDPEIPGLTVVSSLDTDAFATVSYRGLWSPTPGNYNPVDLGTVDTDYATPAASGMSGRVPTGSDVLGDWTGREPALDIGGNRQTGSTRAPGAWAEDE